MGKCSRSLSSKQQSPKSFPLQLANAEGFCAGGVPSGYISSTLNEAITAMENLTNKVNLVG
jgi:hypothetical protein